MPSTYWISIALSFGAFLCIALAWAIVDQRKFHYRYTQRINQHK